MKYKESNKQKYYLRNVYINQIMKPEIQNNLNYAYFENTEVIPNYDNTPNIDINHNNIFFNNKSLNNFYTHKYQTKKDTVSHTKSKNQRYHQNPFIEFNNANLYINNLNQKSCEPKNNFNDRNSSENKMNNMNQTQSFFKKKENKNNNIYNLKVNRNNKFDNILKNENQNNKVDDIHFFDNKDMKFTINDNISNRNTNSNSSVKISNNSKRSHNQRNIKQNCKNGQKTYYSNMNKNEINQINNIILNNACSTASNIINNDNYGFNNSLKREKNVKYKNNYLSNKINKIITNKNPEQFINPSFKNTDRFSNKNVNKNYINSYNSPQRENDDYINVENISSFNSPSIPSYSTIIEDNSVNSNNYVWIKKNIKHNKISNNLDNTIHQNLINFANDITNINSYLYKTEVIFPNYISSKIKRNDEMDLLEHSATLIQATFRGFMVKKKFDMSYYNYKYYYHKGIEILELILNYFFQKHINIIKEKQNFFNYLMSLKKTKIVNRKKNRINQKPKSYKNFKTVNSPFSPVIKNGKIISKFYHDLFLHKEIGERFNIIKHDTKEKEIEQLYKEKMDVINIKVNKLSKENNILKDMNQKNIIMEKKFREISKENQKKDDIINIITNDNKTLARKLKIIQDKYNKLQIQNQEDINYNSPQEQYNKNLDIDMFEEYRNLFLLLLIHKKNEKYYLSILRKFLYKWKNAVFAIKICEKDDSLLKKNKLKYILKGIKQKEKKILYKTFIKFHYINSLDKKEVEIKNNKIKYRLLNIIKNREFSDKSYLKKYFYKFYYKGIIAQKEENKNKNIIKIGKDNYAKIKKLILAIKIKEEKNNKYILREYFIKWHLFTKVLGLKALINDRRRKKRQKQKLKKKNENEANNQYLNNNNKILHFGKSNIYILNKEKEKDLLISLDEHNKNCLTSNETVNNNNKTNNIIEATNKLGELFYKASKKFIFSDKNDENTDKDKSSQNVDNKINNDVEEEEDSGDSLGI